MSRSFVWLVTLSFGAGALGCSDPVPAAAAIGLRLNITPSNSCAADNSRPDDLGNPPPDKDRLGTADPKKGRPVFDGDRGLNASCRVAGDGPFQVSAQVSSAVGSFGIVDGNIAANGTGTANMSFTTPAIGSVGNGSCTLTAVPVVENGVSTPGVKRGAIWATFLCTGLLQQGTPSVNCGASGEILLENCRQD